MDYNLKTYAKKLLADTITPVSVYLRLRDKFPNSLLLESSDYHANDNSFSYICCNPIAFIKVQHGSITTQYPNEEPKQSPIDQDTDVVAALHTFAKAFTAKKITHKFINYGLFGYMAYDAVRYFENIEIAKKEGDLDIPDIYYAVYQNVIAINHFNNEAYLFCHSINTQDNTEQIAQLLRVKSFTEYNLSDPEILLLIYQMMITRNLLPNVKPIASAVMFFK